MTIINHHRVNLFSDSRSNGSSPLVRTKNPANLDSNLSINIHLALIIINMSYNIESKRFSCCSLNRENNLDESSFKAILSNDDASSDLIVSSVASLYGVVRD